MQRKRTLVAALAGGVVFLALELLPVLYPGYFSPMEVLPAAAVGTSEENALCQSCHASGSRIYGHRRMDIEDIDQQPCLLCHLPHGSAGETSRGFMTGSVLRRPAREQCSVCHFEYSPLALAGKKNKGEKVHAPVLKGNCLDCHTEHDAGQRPQLRVAKQDLCISCHFAQAGEQQKAFRHAPFDQRSCTSCHDPHVAPEDALLVIPVKQLCSTCHLDRNNIQGRPVQHAPFEKGLCGSCHNPHASNNTNLLLFEGSKLCFTCHPDRKQWQRKPYSHAPYRQGECVTCHDPHGSNGKKLVNADNITALCGRCHSSLQQEFMKPSHHPVGERMECTSCHVPHAGEYSQLRVAAGNKLCFTCHQGKEWFYRQSGHSRLVNGSSEPGACTACHWPHASDFQPLLKTDEDSLCRSCHGATEMNGAVYNHPVGERYLDPSNGRQLTCTSTCHDPHGTGLKYSVTKKGDGLCLTCHKK